MAVYSLVLFPIMLESGVKLLRGLLLRFCSESAGTFLVKRVCRGAGILVTSLQAYIFPAPFSYAFPGRED